MNRTTQPAAITAKAITPSKTIETCAVFLLAADAGYDPTEAQLRDNVKSTIKAVYEEELAALVTAVAVRASARGMGIGERAIWPEPSALRRSQSAVIRH